MTINPDNAGDLRRAAAFIKHHAYSNRDGMNAILLEALEAQRAGEFVEGILVTYDAIVPQLITPAGQRCMAEMILTFAENTGLDADWNRAARLLIAYGENRRDDMNEIIRETDDVSPTIVAILDIYATILPTLHTPFGMDIIERALRTLSAKEVEPR